MSEENGSPSLEKFLSMNDEKVRAIVTGSPEGRVGVLVPDGNRKAGLVIWGLDPSKKDFDRDLFNNIHSEFLRVVRSFFETGVRTLFIPLLMHTNFDRGKKYMKAAMDDGLKHLFHDKAWLSFYDECNIRVKIYGDLGYVQDRGFDLLLEWVRELEKRTKANDGATLFYGIACNRSHEEVRMASIGMDLHDRMGAMPTRDDLVKEYYGIDAPDIGFFIRPTEVRDSDVQPILISGSKTQMYFPICPVAFLSKRSIRAILHDLIFNRIASGGKKMYSQDDMANTNILKVKDYYLRNLETVLGLGHREGPFWLPEQSVENRE